MKKERPLCPTRGCAALTYKSIYDVLGASYLIEEGFDHIVEGFYREQNSLFEDTVKLLEIYNFNLSLSRQIHDLNYILLSSPERLTQLEEEAYTKQLKELRKKQNQKIKVKIFKRRRIFCPRSSCGKAVISHSKEEEDIVGECVSCKCRTCIKCEDEWKEDHICSKERLETIAEIDSKSKPCPRCNIAISKTHGCDHMFCTNCFVSFHWGTLEITHGGANPHYFETITQRGLEAVREANPNDPIVNRQEQRDCMILRLPEKIKDSFFILEHHKVVKIFEKLQPINPRSESLELTRVRGEFIMGKMDEKEYKSFLKSFLRRKEYNYEVGQIISTLVYVLSGIIETEEVEGFKFEDFKPRWTEMKERANKELDNLAEMFGYQSKRIK